MFRETQVGQHTITSDSTIDPSICTTASLKDSAQRVEEQEGRNGLQGHVMANTIKHIPVMLEEVMTWLNPQANSMIVDATLGLGGHAEAIIKKIAPQGRLVAIDRDARSLQMAKKRLSAYAQRCHFVQGDFKELDSILRELGITGVDGILLDLGLSSFQLEDARRGFSFQVEGPLDMRMDESYPLSAFDLVNSLSEGELSSILRNYGEERWHNRIARSIVRQRSEHPIETTKDLKEIILRAVPYRLGIDKIHPATRTFQALRIAVNQELETLRIMLDKSIDVLKPGGRIGVIAFHSLEDRIVKHQFLAWAKSGRMKVMTKKPLRPTEGERQRNPRSRSARLRIVERIA